VDSATIARPTENVGTSPKRLTIRPLAGANTSRTNANTLTTTDAAVMPTSNDLTNTGSVGAISP
jgi:hypothetical protein